MIALVCVDVDGTLVGSSGTVPPEVWPAAARLRAAGVRLALCSGRPAFGLAREYAERLDPDGWHVFQNGASVVHLASGASRSIPLPPGSVDALVERTREAHAAGGVGASRVLELYTDTEYAVEDTGDRARRHAALLGVPFTPRPLASLGGTIVRAQWLVAVGDADAVSAERVNNLTMLASTSPVMPDTAFVNITAAGVDKGVAVRAVADAYGVPMRRVMMVGDGANDVTALRAVGLGVAMGNAEPEARAAAARTVSDVDAGGLVEALALAAR